MVRVVPRVPVCLASSPVVTFFCVEVHVWYLYRILRTPGFYAVLQAVVNDLKRLTSVLPCPAAIIYLVLATPRHRHHPVRRRSDDSQRRHGRLLLLPYLLSELRSITTTDDALPHH